MTTRARRRGLLAFCPFTQRHRVLHAWLGAAPSARGGAPALRLFVRIYRDEDGRKKEGYAYVETQRDGSGLDSVVVSCTCNRGTSWSIDPRRIASLVPDSDKLDVNVEELT